MFCKIRVCEEDGFMIKYKMKRGVGMKKVICVFISLFMMTGCTLKQKDANPIELTPQEVIDKIKDDKQNTFLLYLTSDDCYTCQQYTKVVKELEKESHFDIFYLKINPNEKDRDTKAALDELNIMIGNYTELPMTYYFYQGTLLPENKKEGYIEKSDFHKWLRELHLMK